MGDQPIIKTATSLIAALVAITLLLTAPALAQFPGQETDPSASQPGASDLDFSGGLFQPADGIGSQPGSSDLRDLDLPDLQLPGAVDEADLTPTPRGDSPPAGVAEEELDLFGKQFDRINGKPAPEATHEDTHEDVVPIETDSLWDEEPPLLFSSGSWFWNGKWYAQFDATMMVRSDPRGVILGFDGSLAVPVILTTLSDRVGWEPGGRVTVGRFLGRDRHNNDQLFEFSFLGFLEFTAADAIFALNAGQINTILGPGGASVSGFNNADVQAFTYDTDLNSYEANFRIRTRTIRDRMILRPDGHWFRHVSPSALRSYLAGFRYIRIDESFLYQSQGADSSGDYSVRTSNDLFGFQVGAECIDQYERGSWGLRAKAGPMVNFALRESRLITEDGGVDGRSTEDVDDEHLVFMAEVGLFATYQLRCNLALRASYDVLFLQGLALAPENLGITGPGSFVSFNTSGLAYYHGVSAGFELIW